MEKELENKIQVFNSYRLEKRLEITKMQSIISNFYSDLHIKERRLLLASYIVLTYAYWESCFYKFQDLLFLKYQSVIIKQLPFKLQSAVYLEFAKDAAGNNKSKTIKEIRTYKTFDTIYKMMHKNDLQTIKSINYETKVKNIFTNQTQNPNLEMLNKLLEKYNMKANKGIKDGNLAPFFSVGLDFIIHQRNSIAHKNEEINYQGSDYKTYESCFKKLKEDVNTIKYENVEDFISEMGYQIDLFYGLLIEMITGAKNAQNNK